MEFFATRKALAYFSVQPTPGTVDYSFHQWGMMFKKVDRRNFLMVMHLKSKYTIAFYGFTKGKHNEPQVTSLMRSFFESKQINQKVIEEMLDPTKLQFHTTSSHSVASKMTQQSYHFPDYQRYFDTDSFLQSEVNDDINWLEGMLYAEADDDSFFIQLQKEYADAFLIPEAIELKTELVLDNYTVERHFLVDPQMNLFDLHRLLQIGYQYTDSYQHSFYTIDDQGEIYEEISNLIEIDDELYMTKKGMENEFTIEEILEEVDQFLYVYNFQADWKVLITPLKFHQNIKQRLPICLQSTAEAPNEALNSEEDYDLYLEFLEQIVHPMLRRYFEPRATFDLASINTLIQKELFR